MDKVFENCHAVIFDMDGVLVDSEPFYVDVEQANFKKLGLNITNMEHLTYQGTATDRMWRLIKKRHNIKFQIDKLVKMTNDMVIPYFESLKEIPTVPYVETVINELKKNKIPLALASSSIPEVIEIILKKTDLKKYFDVVVDSVMAGHSKPDPNIFILAAEKLGKKVEKCVVIEDSTNGIIAAKKAGMYCVAYSANNNSKQNVSLADRVICDFRELL